MKTRQSYDIKHPKYEIESQNPQKRNCESKTQNYEMKKI